MATASQKEKFENEFKNLIDKSPETIKKIWASTGKFFWIDLDGMSSQCDNLGHITTFLPEDIFEEYKNLIIKLRNGTI